MTRLNAEINITPLIDVMLVLLIIFMVVIPPATNSVDSTIPEDSPPPNPTPPPPALVLDVGAEGVLALNSKPLSSLSELSMTLTDVLASRTDKTVFVRGTTTARYGAVVSAMDAARGAGAERIGVVTTAPPQ